LHLNFDSFLTENKIFNEKLNFIRKYL